MTTKNTAKYTARWGADPIRARGLTLAWSGVDSRPIQRWRGLFAALLVVLGAAVAAPEARAAVLVSNIGQTTDDTGSIPRHAQPFRTGAHTAGYTLTSILLDCGDCDSYTTGTVTLHSGTRMGTKVADFTITLDAQNLLATPTTATTLSAGTTYVIVTANDFPDFGQWFAAASNALDSTSAAGWTIPAGYEFYKPTSSAWVSSTYSKQFIVNGDPITANNAPVVDNAIPDQTAKVGAAEFYYAVPTNTFSDADSDTLIYTATKADGMDLPTWLTFTSEVSRRYFFGTPAAADVGVVSVKVTVSDGKGGSVSDVFDITVEVDTTPPTLTTATVISTGTNILLVFNEAMTTAGTGLPQASAFTVTADGIAVPVDQTGASGPSLVVTLSPVYIRQGQDVVVTYTDPTTGDDTRAIQDTSGNDAASFTTGMSGVAAVTNNSEIAPSAPAAPTGLSAIASGTTTINLSWTAPVDYGGSAITGYKIEVSSDSGSTWTDQVTNTASTTTTYEHTGLTASTTRHYRVSAINSIGTGTSSDDANATTGTAANNAPVVAIPIPDQTATEGALFSYAFPDTTFTDADSGDTLSYTATKGDGANLLTWLTFTPATRTFTGTPAATDVETVSVKVTADDSNGGLISDVFDIVVGAAANAAPTVANVIPDQTATAGTDFSYEIPANTFTDVDTGDTLSYTATKADGMDLPTWLGFDAATRIFKGTPTALDVETVSVKVTANDSNGGLVSDVFDITVTAIAPNAPTGLSAIASGTTTINLSWTAPASDGGSVITGYKIEVSSDSGSTWTDQVANTASTTTTYEHTGLAASTTRHYRVSAINSIGASTTSDVVDATTGTAGNNAPVVENAIPDQTATAGTDFSYEIPANTFTDVDTGDTLSYTATKADGMDLPTWLTFTPATRIFKGTPTALDVETVSVKVTANDSNGGLVSDVFDITVTAIAPGAPTGLTATASGADTINLSWTAPVDNGGSAITGYKIEISTDSGATWTDLVADTASTTTTYEHTGLAASTTRHYRVSAINSIGAGATLSDVVITTAGTAANNAPTVTNPIPDQTATTGAAFNYAFPDTTFTDADTLSYTATQSDGANLPIWLTFTPATRAFTGTPMVTDAQTLTVKVTASDPNSATVSDEFEIIVSAAPVVITHCNATDPNELWCAGLTVGTDTAGGDTVFGYKKGSLTSWGALTDDEFIWRTATVIVTAMQYVVGGELVLGTDRLRGLAPSDGLLGSGDFALEIGAGASKKTIAINSPGTTTRHRFTNPGLSWTVNQVVPVKLLRIPNPGPIPQAWIARFGRTVADQVLEAVQSRMANPAPGVEASLAGQQIGVGSESGKEEQTASSEDARQEEQARRDALRVAEWLQGETEGGERQGGSRALSPRGLLTSSSFTLTQETPGKDLASLWGRGAVTRFDGREGDLTLDGEVVTGMLGADWTRGRWAAGLILSHSAGEGGYAGAPADTDGTAGTGGRVEATLTGLFPWARHTLSGRLEAWGAAGYGTGELTVTPKTPGTDKDPGSGSGAGGAAIRADLDLRMAAAGLRGTLLDGGGDGLTLTGKTDALIVETASGRGKGADGGNLEPARAMVTRLRLGVEASHPLQPGGGGTVLTPSLEVGFRHDGGDAETGFGLDLGAGLRLSDPARGLEVEIRGRGLLSHESDGFRERGFSGALSWRQKPSSDRGATLTLTQTVGGSSSGGADALLSRTTLDGLAANDPGSGIGAGDSEGGDDELKSQRLELKLGYGLSAFGGRFTWTPEAYIGLSDTGRDYSLGWRLVRGGSGNHGGSLELSFEARRSESVNDDTQPVLGVGFTLTARF